MQHEDVARCEVAASHLAKFGNRRVQCPGVAPCDFSLTILPKSGGKGKVDANVLGLPKMYLAGDSQRAAVSLGNSAVEKSVELGHKIEKSVDFVHKNDL